MGMKARGEKRDPHDPFARLLQTHRRLEERLDELVRATEEDDMNTVEDVVHFLARGAARHVEDEEVSLFPRLRRVPELAGLLASYEDEHREHQALEEKLAEAADHGDSADLTELAQKLREVYRRHIEREESELFPAAQRALPPEEIQAMGLEMAARRGDRGQSE